MAKKDKNNAEDNKNEEEGGGKVITVLIVFIIVIIWLAIFGVLIKLDVGNFGSEVMYPVFKDVPVLNKILPETSNGGDEGTTGEYDNLTEANAKIKELESKLAATSDSDSANSSEIEKLKAEISRLEKYEDAQKSFAERVKEFDSNVVFNDKAPDTEEYKKYYEGIEPDNAEKIYEKVSREFEYSQEIKDQAEMYSKMEASKAAAILEEMSSDLDLVASILDNMKAASSAGILSNMKPTTAAQITTKMTSMKKN